MQRSAPQTCAPWLESASSPRWPGVVSTTISRSSTFLGHGADNSAHWISHEPASILHELVWHEDYEAMQFLIDGGIDMTIDDYRWGGTAQGWAYHAAKDERMALWLAEAQPTAGACIALRATRRLKPNREHILGEG